jgi:hypothetical protein
MCLHAFIHAIPAALSPQQEREENTATREGPERITTRELPGTCGRRGPVMTETELTTRAKYLETSQVRTPKTSWFIITSEEIAIIHRNLSEIEKTERADNKEYARKISHVLEIVRERLA